MRSIAQLLQPTRLVSRQPTVHRLQAHPPFCGHLGDRPALADHSEDCLVPLFRHDQLPHVRECQESAETGVKHHPKPCQGSAGTPFSSISRISKPDWLGRLSLIRTTKRRERTSLRWPRRSDKRFLADRCRSPTRCLSSLTAPHRPAGRPTSRGRVAEPQPWTTNYWPPRGHEGNSWRARAAPRRPGRRHRPRLR